MGERTVPVHYLRGNAAERTPRRVACIDCETTWSTGGNREVHTLRLWRGELTDRRRDTDPQAVTETAGGRSGTALAAWLNGLARTSATLWVYAHNLGFDLSVSGLPYELTLLGWELTDHALASDQPWARMRRGNYHLVLADSLSLFRIGERGLAKLLGIGYVELPQTGEPDAAWDARCASDVRILRQAVLTLMQWWDSEEAGNWTLSGPGLGWNLYRHRFPPLRVVIDPNLEARAMERDALYSGFGYVRQQGTLSDGPYADVDFRHAYLTLAATQDLPMKRGKRFDSLSLDDPLLTTPGFGILARVRVRTGVPRYPVRLGSNVWHPTGEFWTTLAGPEVVEALRRGELEEIGPGYAYALGGIMTGWARWLVDLLDHPTEQVPRVVYPVLKAWSRSVMGRWAVRTGRVVREGPDPRPGWLLETGEYGFGHAPFASLTLGGHNQWIVSDEDGENAFPAVLAWLQSWTRLLLCRAVECLGDAVEVANTDGVIVNLETMRARFPWCYGPPLGDGSTYAQVADDVAGHLGFTGYPLEARVKRQGASITVLSPMHVLFGGERMLAGIPADAEAVEALTYEFWTWPGFRVAVREGGGERYTRKLRRVNLSEMKPLGWRLASGHVWPARLYVDETGTNRIVPSFRSDQLGWFLAPRERQHPLLAPLIRDDRDSWSIPTTGESRPPDSATPEPPARATSTLPVG